MISMSKEEMIRYLRDYASIQNLAVYNPNVSIGNIFSRYMIENKRFNDNNREYYDRMRRIYTTYIYLKSFSITEDFLLNRDDFLSNNDLRGMENGITISSLPSDITNKRIVQLIRNAFNHNDNPDFDRFKFSKSARNMEIEFKDIRTNREIANGVPVKPVKIKINTDYLIKVNEIITRERQNVLFLSFDIPEDFDIYAHNLEEELNKIKFIHYYFNRKMNKETIDTFREKIKVEGLSNAEIINKSQELHNFASSINQPVEYHLSELQKEKLKENINYYRKNYPELLKNNINFVMYYFLERTIPIPIFKQKVIGNQIILSDGYFIDLNLSINEIITREINAITDESFPSHYDVIDKDIHDTIKNKSKRFKYDLFKDTLSGEFLQIFPTLMYIDAVTTHYCKDEEIIIDGINYSKEKIRNSFVHGRWFTLEDDIIMYDADPRNINDYNLEYLGRININSFTSWANNYMDSHNKSKISNNKVLRIFR